MDYCHYSWTVHAHSVHGHDKTLVQEAVRQLNPGQSPVLAADQPLYALAKQIQWTWPTTLGEKHFVVMFGGLHIEMAVLKVYDHFRYFLTWLDIFHPLI